jgi:CBS domain-containing protein
MTDKLQTATPDKTLGHALHLMFEGGFRHVPVVEDGRPVGMVSARNALGLEILQFEKELKERDHIAEIL